MRKLLSIFMFALTLGATLPVIAGPDSQQLQAIERARNERLEQAAALKKAGPDDRCASQQVVLPLDHGPHAQTTPYLNQLRKARFKAEMKACK